jgi:hypothetical protein
MVSLVIRVVMVFLVIMVFNAFVGHKILNIVTATNGFLQKDLKCKKFVMEGKECPTC